jgi:hypothetical protein
VCQSCVSSHVPELEYAISSIVVYISVAMYSPENIADPAIRNANRLHLFDLARGQDRARILEEGDGVTRSTVVVLRADGDVVSRVVLENGKRYDGLFPSIRSPDWRQRTRGWKQPRQRWS